MHSKKCSVAGFPLQAASQQLDPANPSPHLLIPTGSAFSLSCGICAFLVITWDINPLMTLHNKGMAISTMLLSCV